MERGQACGTETCNVETATVCCLTLCHVILISNTVVLFSFNSPDHTQNSYCETAGDHNQVNKTAV
jgi:hypothetical protein